MPRKKFDSGKIRVLILNVHTACLDPDIPPYFRFSKEYGFVSSNIGTMAQAISHSGREINLGTLATVRFIEGVCLIKFMICNEEIHDSNTNLKQYLALGVGNV